MINNRPNKNSAEPDQNIEEKDSINSMCMVFTCSKCNTFLSDSMALCCSIPDLNAITVSGANNINRLDELQTSKKGFDRGSTFYSLQCQSCRTTIGKYYFTTPRILDEARERFTLFIDSISSYQLGNYQIGEVQPNNDITKRLTPNNTLIEQQAFDEELNKIHHVIFSIVHRLDVIEQQLGITLPSQNLLAQFDSIPNNYLEQPEKKRKY